MKKLTLILIACLSMIVGCTCHTTSSPAVVTTTPPYEYIQSPTGQQMVVVHDNSGAEFLMEYMLFTSLMNSGGYGAVINNYHTYPTRYTVYNRSNYNNWRSFNGTRYNPDKYSGFRSSGNYSNSSSGWKNTTPSSSGNGWNKTTPSSNYRKVTPSNSGFRSTPSYTKPSSSSSGFRSSTSSSRSSSSSSGFRSSSSSSSSSGFRKRN